MVDAPAPLTRFAAESWRTALLMHSRVTGALVMRDLQTRFGASYLGFLVGLIMPLGHLGIALVVMTIFSRSPPLGTTQAVFLTTGILPFVLWNYCHRQIMVSIQQNRPLLYFPGVDIFDIIFARMIVEIANGALVVSIVMLTLALIGMDFTPNDPMGLIFSLSQAWLFGVASGILFGTIGFMWLPFMYAGALIAPLFWISCGILYIPDAAPEKVRDVIFYLPLTQIVDATRAAYFSEYYSVFQSSSVLWTTLLGTLFLGMLLILPLRKIT